MDLIAQFTAQNCPGFAGKAGDWSHHNVGVTPRFFIDKIVRKNPDGTETIFEVEKIQQFVAGDDLTAASDVVTDQHRERFADAYAAFKAGTDIVIGTPLTSCPFISDRQDAFLQTLNIFNVEALSQLSDYNVTNVPDGRELRDKASRWLRKKGTDDLAAKYEKALARIDALEKERPKRKRKEMPAEQRAVLSAKQKALRARLKALDEEAASRAPRAISGEEGA